MDLSPGTCLGPYEVRASIGAGVADGPSVFTHPLCLNTLRNGVFIGTEAVAVGY